MEVTAIKLMKLEGALRSIAGQRIPLRTASTVKDNWRTVKNKVEDIQEQRQNIIEEYAETDENGDIVQEDGVPEFESKDAEQKCQSGIADLLNSELEVDLEVIDIDNLSNIEISPSSLDILLEEGIIEE